jgi:hypothetical protein
MVSGCVGFVGFFALTFGSSWSATARFVRRVSSFFQVRRTSLVTNADDLTALDDPKGVENLRHEGTQLLHTVRAGHRYHDGNAARAQVLLKREVPVNREKRLEVLGNHKLQEFTVALGRPTQINDVMCVVAGQITQPRPRARSPAGSFRSSESEGDIAKLILCQYGANGVPRPPAVTYHVPSNQNHS